MSDLQGTTIVAGEASESDDDIVVIPENVVCILTLSGVCQTEPRTIE